MERNIWNVKELRQVIEEAEKYKNNIDEQIKILTTAIEEAKLDRANMEEACNMWKTVLVRIN